MKYFIVDDDPAVRAILTNILESVLNADVIGTESDGANITAKLLNHLDVDILILDLLMPKRDGIDTLEAIYPDFQGKTVMLSQVETKEIIASAYERNIEAYILKPINNLEVTCILKKIEKNARLESSLEQIKSSLQIFDSGDSDAALTETNTDEKTILVKEALSDLGIRFEKGSEDLILLVQLLGEKEDQSLPPLKDLWHMIAEHQKKGGKVTTKDIKATEQRIRRATLQSFHHICSLGAMDMTHPKFEYYAMKFFDLEEVQQRVYEISHTQESHENLGSPRLNIKRFVFALYDECNN